jgi:hypothetical protein
VSFGSEVRYTFPMRFGDSETFVLPVKADLYWYNARIECFTAEAATAAVSAVSVRLMLETAEGARVLWSGLGQGWIGLGWPIPATGLVSLVVSGSTGWLRVELQGFTDRIEDHQVLLADGLPQWLFHRGENVRGGSWDSMGSVGSVVWSAHEVRGDGEATGVAVAAVAAVAGIAGVAAVAGVAGF